MTFSRSRVKDDRFRSPASATMFPAESTIAMPQYSSGIMKRSVSFCTEKNEAISSMTLGSALTWTMRGLSAPGTPT